MEEWVERLGRRCRGGRRRHGVGPTAWVELDSAAIGSGDSESTVIVVDLPLRPDQADAVGRGGPRADL